MHTSLDRQLLSVMEIEVRLLRDALLTAERSWAAEIAATHPIHRRSAANLVHYLELRRHDVRDLQERLASVGLSSLGRSEAGVLASVEAVLELLSMLNGHVVDTGNAPVGLEEGRELLDANAERLLGPTPPSRGTRIMVTMPSEAADSDHVVDELVDAGLDLARVNCAHDDAAAWNRMIDRLHASRRHDGRRPLVAMDLGGPKVRTGPIATGAAVIKISPRRDRLGLVVMPAVVWLAPPTTLHVPPDGSITLPVADDGWIRRREAGERIRLVDTRGAKREWTVVSEHGDGCVVEVSRTTYVSTGLELCVGDDDDVFVGDLTPVEQAHRVHAGETVILTPNLEPAVPVAGGPHVIGCTLAEVFDSAVPGEPVWFDDGKFGGVIRSVTPDAIGVEVTDCHPSGVKLKAGKGINFPDTHLSVAALTEHDVVDLDVVAARADLVSLSFVREPDDVVRLQHELAQRDAAHVGVVLKIENRAAFEHLPGLLLAAMRSERAGVMIARGDLAVEVGFERLAEVQEEIMWACEAAHVPVIWATQVLDTLARTGQPSRAEITDAAMSVRAECVMLNKGPHTADAIRALDSILARMQHHQHKKRSLLRRLEAWDRDRSE